MKIYQSNTCWYEMKYLVIWNFHTFNITILFISNVRNDLKWSERNVVIRNNLEMKKIQGFQTEVSCWKGFSHQNGQKHFGANWRGEGGIGRHGGSSQFLGNGGSLLSHLACHNKKNLGVSKIFIKETCLVISLTKFAIIYKFSIDAGYEVADNKICI